MNEYKSNLKYNDSVRGKIIRFQFKTVEAGIAPGNKSILIFKGSAARRSSTYQNFMVAISNMENPPYYYAIQFEK